MRRTEIPHQVQHTVQLWGLTLSLSVLSRKRFKPYHVAHR